MEIGSGGDDVAVHGPVVVFAEGETIGRVVVVGFRERDEVGGIDEGNVVAVGKADAQSAGGALVIVDAEYGPTEGGGPSIFGRLFRGFGFRCCDRFAIPQFLAQTQREVAGDEGLAHCFAICGKGNQMLKAILKSREDLTDVGDADFAADRCFAICFIRLPKAIASQVAERQVGIVLVVEFSDKKEACGEAIAQFLVPRDVSGRGLSFIDQIQCGEEQKRFVRLFVGAAFFDRRRADAERVKALDGLVNRGKGWCDFLEGLVRRGLADTAGGVEGKP